LPDKNKQIAKVVSAQQPTAKRRKLSSQNVNESKYDTLSGGGKNDTNDSVCRICKHPGDLVCCEGCPSSYHADCIRPRMKQEWLDQFEEWFCPSCAPRNSYIPLRDKKSKEKWPQHLEPLLQDLSAFLKQHSHLERDWNPEPHPKRKDILANAAAAKA